MNAAEAHPSAPEQQPWTDHALLAQMSVLDSILQGAHVDLKYLGHQCLLLSKILDSLVANNWKPAWRTELLPLIRKVCKHRDTSEARPTLLILLLSVKNAFREEWLSSAQLTENDEIFSTLNLIFDALTTGDDVSGTTPTPTLVQLLQCGGSAAKDFQEARVYLDSISNRFYPRLQVNSIFVAVYAQVRYEVLVCDFHVPRLQHLEDRVYLYVGRTDITETSACIITPLQVSILVNGEQVENRVTNGYLDAGPQMPSDVTNLVKVGSNVLQAIGEFSVPYVIAIASSRAIERLARNAELDDHVAPTKAAGEVDLNVTEVEVDDEVVEGASRVSLRCPISHQRLVMPVKATTCRHLQCFDYDSFLEINETRPTWRCPCCNRFISCPDLRLDRQMEKVLKHTDERIHEVIFNQDGSWEPVATDDDDNTDRGPDVATLEAGEIGGSKIIDLSDMDGDENEEISDSTLHNNSSDTFQQHERKPDTQTLQAVLENRRNNNNSETTNPPGVHPQNPVISVPECAPVASESSSSFSEHFWAGGGIQEGIFVNIHGGGPHSRTASRGNSLAATASPVNNTRLAPNTAHTTTTTLEQVQPPHSVALSNTGLVTENEWVWQRQVGQQSPGASQNVQNVGMMRPQWRSTGVNTAPSHNVVHDSSSQQHLYSNQSQASHSPRQHASPGSVFHPHHAASPGNNSQQQQQQQRSSSPGLNSHHIHSSPGVAAHRQHSGPGVSHQQRASLGNSQQQQQRPGPGVSSQQWPGVWGSASVGHWHSTSSSVSQAQALGGGGGGSGGCSGGEESWRPAQRMRGSIPNPALRHGALGASPSAAVQQQQQQAPVNAFPSTPTCPDANSGAVPAPRFHTGIPLGMLPGMPAPSNHHSHNYHNNHQQGASASAKNNNVSLYNGTTWVNAPDFATPPPAPLFSGAPTAEGWMNFDDLDLPGLPR